MKISKTFLIGIILIYFFGITEFQAFYGNHKDIVEDILESVKSSIQEINSVGSFYTKESKAEIYNNIIVQAEKSIGQVEINLNDKNKFIVKNNEEEYSCEILLSSYKDGYDVEFRASLYGNNLTFSKKNELKTMMRSVLSIIDSDVEYSLCVKSKIIDNTIDEVRDKVIDKLRFYKAENIDEIRLTNGYSIIGYTGLYPKKEVFGQDIDFNCAIVKYSSGCYLITGESEITINY